MITAADDDREYAAARAQMVRQVQAYGVRDERILAALGRLPRHRFIPADAGGGLAAYGDHPCDIGNGQTISQPYIVAYMTERLGLAAGEKVLEIGTGCGYQSAVLLELGVRLYTIERLPALARHAAATLRALLPGRAANSRVGDGYAGWPEAAPFDAILVACAAPEVPVALEQQLAEAGRMIVPVGNWEQRLILVRRHQGRIEHEPDLPVRFVPMRDGVAEDGSTSPTDVR